MAKAEKKKLDAILNEPEAYLPVAQEIFPMTELGEERKCITIEFPK